MYYFVYAIAWSARGPTKIGMTDHVISRLTALQVSNPYRLQIYHALRFEERDHAYLVERETLRELKDYRLMGEWVKLAPNAVGRYIWANAELANRPFTKWAPTATDRKLRKASLRRATKARPLIAIEEAEALGLNIETRRKLLHLGFETW